MRCNTLRLRLTHALGAELRGCRLQRTTPQQGFRLGKAVGDQQIVLVAQLRLVALGGDQELHRDDVRALVDELEEGVLGIGARLAPHHRPVGRATGAPSRVTDLPLLSMSSCWR